MTSSITEASGLPSGSIKKNVSKTFSSQSVMYVFTHTLLGDRLLGKRCAVLGGYFY